MSEKKNIDKLFKEQLKNFEVAPNDAVWEHIERKLHKDKRKRRVIPIWWKIAGVAALLVLLFTVGNTLFNDHSNNSLDHEVVDTNTSNSDAVDDTKEATNPSDTYTSEDTNTTEIVDNKDSEAISDNNTNDDSTQQLTTSESSNQKNTVVTPSEDSRSEEPLKKASVIKNESQQRDAIANNKTTIEKDTNDKTKVASTQKNAVATNSQNSNKNDVDQKKLPKKQQEIDKLIKNITGENTTAITSSNTSERENTASTIDSSKVNKLIKQANTTNSKAVTSANTSEKENAASAIDSTKANDIIKEENAIDKAIAEAEETLDSIYETEQPLKRWSVAPNVAPVYFNTLGKGSSLDNQFINNTKEGDVSMSYGVKGSYAISNKLKIRAGVNKVDLGYSTNNILAFDGASPNESARQMKNVRLNDSLNNAYVSANSVNFASGPEILFTKEQGSINQQLGFIEVPIELEYNLVDNKIGLNLIGGFSTLFLSNNEIYSVLNNGDRTLVGEATNINDMSYSANFGVGVNYNISEKLRFNLEPTFKYQINTFSDTSGDFQPFFIGVYTGLSFKF
jgi:chemotaxis protein histidine kinase CheA